MTDLASYMAEHHKHCDEYFTSAEELAAKANWGEAQELSQKFVTSLDEHLRMEEEVLFPAFEEASGMTGGPTQMMRFEHTQMRELATAIQEAAASKDREAYLSASETLLVMMQQHNIKEEQVLYPMADAHLSDEVDSLISRMAPYRTV